MKKFVKDKVSEFKLEPKAQTWDNIEAALHKKKRVAIWWFVLPLTFILGVASTILINKLNTSINTAKTVQSDLKKKENAIIPFSYLGKEDLEGQNQEKKNIGLSQKSDKVNQSKRANSISIGAKNNSSKKTNTLTKQVIQKKATISHSNNSIEEEGAKTYDKKGSYGKTTLRKKAPESSLYKDSISTLTKASDEKTVLELEDDTIDTLLVSQDKRDSGQGNKDKTIMDNQKANWNIGVYAGLGKTNNYRSLQKDNINKQLGYNNLVNDQRVNEEPLTGTSYGVSLDRDLRHGLNLGFSIGLTRYSWMTFTGDSITNSIVNIPVNDPSWKVELFEQNGNQEYKNILQTYSVQAQIGKEVIQKNRLSLSTAIGIGYERVYKSNILHYSHLQNIYATSNENSSNYRRGFMTASISLPLEYKSKGNFSYWLSPSLKTSINSYLNSDFETQRPYFYGILGGIKYHL